MKKVLSILITVTICFQIGFIAFAAPSRTSSDDFSIKVANNTLQFVKNNKVTKSVPMKNSKIKLLPKKDGGLAVKITDNTGKVRTFGLKGQSELKISGKIDSIYLDKNLSNHFRISIEKDSSVKEMKVAAPCKVSIAGKVSSINITHPKANVSVDKSASVREITTVSGSNIKGVPSSKITVSENTSLASTYSSMQEETRTEDKENTRYDYEETPNVSENTNSSYRIDRIESSLGQVTVTLNRATPTALTKNDFAILCNGSGKDMTILNVSTNDNRVYVLSTAYYDDNEYFLSIKLPDGSLINKTFTTSLVAPGLKAPKIDRVDDTSATFTFVSDQDGSLYYLLKEVAPSSRSMWTGDEDPTPAQIKSNGTKIPMKQYSNTFTIKNLKANTAYTVFYVAEDASGKLTPINYADIPSSSAGKPEQSSISITNIESHKDMSDFNRVHHWFTITLSSAPAQDLTLENFKVTCPAENDTSLSKIEKTSPTVYTIYLKENVILKSDNNFTFTITFSDGSQTSSTKFLDFAAPVINDVKVIRTGANTANVTFQSTEPGKLYWKVYPNSNLPEANLPATIQDIVSTGKTFDKMQSNVSHTLTLTSIPEKDATVYLVAEDTNNNLGTFAEHDPIPNEISGKQEPTPQPQADSSLVIESVDVRADKHSALGDVDFFTLTLNEQTNLTISDIEIQGSGVSLSGNNQLADLSQSSSSPKQCTFYTRTKLQSGAYTITVHSNGKTASKEFTIA